MNIVWILAWTTIRFTNGVCVPKDESLVCRTLDAALRGYKYRIQLIDVPDKCSKFIAPNTVLPRLYKGYELSFDDAIKDRENRK